jgi:hypothetical protein
MEGFSAPTVLVNISARSARILRLEGESRPGGADSDFLRVISLPVAVDVTRVTCELDGGELVLKLPPGQTSLCLRVPHVNRSPGLSRMPGPMRQ